MSVRERWAALVVVVAGCVLGAVLGWLQWDGVEVDL